MALVKADLISNTATNTGLSRAEAKFAVEAVFSAVAEALVRDERVVIRRFGAFLVTPRKQGMARNPRTGEAVPIPPGRMARFRPGSRLRHIPLSAGED